MTEYHTLIVIGVIVALVAVVLVAAWILVRLFTGHRNGRSTNR